MTETQYVYGTFIQETKNRFLCTVDIDSEEVECYIPSSCRLSNFLDLKGRTVILTPNQDKTARTRFAVYAVKIGSQFILLNLSKPNRIIESELHKRRFAFLGKRKNILHEKTIEGYKSDLYIEDTKTIVEIKSILSFEKTAIFPTVYSERGVKQLTMLSGLLDRGYHVCYLFVSLNPNVKRILVNPKLEDYSRRFNDCMNSGMLCYGISLKLQDKKPVISSTISVGYRL